jgi:hypothetical protein
MSNARDRAAGYDTEATPGANAPAAGAPSGAPSGAPGPRHAEPGYARGDYGGDYGDGRAVAQAGFTVLAATLMILSGLLSFVEGLVEIFRTGSFITTLPNYTFAFSVHSWGWIHLGIGIVLFAAGACVLLGQAWARALGIVLAVCSAIANFIFIPYYPFWSIVLIAVDVFIIWALATGMGRRASA